MPVTRQTSAIMAGTVAHFASSTAPSGWIKANGAAVSRSLYAALFNAIGTAYGVGDGSTTFNVPDLRGEFVRSLDDGRGVDTGRGIGSGQAFATQAQSGTVTGGNPGDFGTFNGASGIASVSGALVNRPQGSAGGGSLYTLSLSVGTPGATETRPRNVALLACIKF